MATVDINIASRLPTNIEAERAVLGAILLNSSAYNEAADRRKAENFSLDSPQTDLFAMVDLAESSRPIDMITLVEELDQHKEREAVGDVVFQA
jgi:replicative DNA helicase